ncbi:hypothetical protein [Candidatus Mycoplasma haematobovis]|uniref:hypothetical protein n=1 Tax=Candidatus Mycoplasma haematobovis TaxID=432608 RepID=UPI0016505DF7|nr:hypothetical protein [Candidatus Mycoplasma haematobovis]
MASLSYHNGNWTPNVTNISSIDNIEDLEHSKGCKFLFYKKNEKTNAFSQGKIKDARSYSTENKDKENNQIQQVTTHKDKCEKNRFIYIEMD